MADLLGTRPNARRRLRESLAGPEPVLAPGAYDALSARLVAMAGFPAVYMTGFGVAASAIGRPDVGLLTMTEMADSARRIVAAVDVPVVADADTGYGNALNVIRTVHEYEAAGVAGLHLEDQSAPKRCGHMTGKDVVPAEVMADRIRAAVAARGDPDLLIIARTDARAVEGLRAALDRGRRYRDAGADMLFLEAMESEREIEAVAGAFPDVPLLFNWAEGGRTPGMAPARLRDLGYRLVIFPVTPLFAATRGVRAALAALAGSGCPGEGEPAEPTPLTDFFELMGLPEVQEIERRFPAG
jgi:2-methylisocitrate lyase-like PEP mutase family enzyme